MQRALIVKLGAIGDVVMAIPAVYALHQRGMRIDWVCGPAVAGLLRSYSWINVIEADERGILFGGRFRRIKAFARVWGLVIRSRYDLVATLYYDARWQLIALPARSRRRLSLSQVDRSRRILPGRHHANEFHRVLLGLEDTCHEQTLLPVRPDRLERVSFAKSKGRRVAIVPGGAGNLQRQQILRRWPIQHYAAVVQALHAQGDEIVLLGGPDDAWVREHLEDCLNAQGIVDLIGRTSLTELIAVFDTCDLVLTHDTGPLHLAALSHAPIVALFGPTDPGNFLPRRPGVHVLWGGEQLACRPCHDGRDFAACHHNACMHSISVEIVLRAIESVLPVQPDPKLPLIPVIPAPGAHPAQKNVKPI